MLEPTRNEHSTPKTLKLVLLDRDGVLCHDSPDYIRSPADWRSIKGSMEALAKLKLAGIRCAVCTNQAGIGRGIFDHQALASTHQHMEALIQSAGGQLDMIRYCPHHPDAGCRCRKPAPGMLIDVLNELGVPAANALFAGDSFSDMQAAKRAHVQGAFLRHDKPGRDTNTIEQQARDSGVALVYANLADLVEDLLSSC